MEATVCGVHWSKDGSNSTAIINTLKYYVYLREKYNNLALLMLLDSSCGENEFVFNDRTLMFVDVCVCVSVSMFHIWR